jgi:Uma2 family endonuclease
MTALGDEYEYEVVKGRRFAKAYGARQGRICVQVIAELGRYLKRSSIGKIFASNTTYLIGDEERLPSASFISMNRIPVTGVPAGRWEIAPDLAVEVIGHDDLYSIVVTKLYDYFAAGVREVWLVEPVLQTLTVYTAPTRNRIMTENDELTSELLPGFSCRVANFFQP